MQSIDTLRQTFPEAAKDIKLNLQSTLQDTVLNEDQRWGVAVAAAATTRHEALYRAVLADARQAVRPEVIEDAQAAAALMAMNNVFYRFRHLVNNPVYAQKPARLRMNRLAKPAANKIDFELFALAVSALNACGTCVEAHEKAVIEGGLTDQHVLDAVRLAATVQAAAVVLVL